MYVLMVDRGDLSYTGALDGAETISRLFCDQAAVAVAYSIEIKTLRDAAVQTRSRIGQAVGIVMERFEIPAQQAFAFLIRVSQTAMRELLLIAGQLIQGHASGERRPLPLT